MVKKSPIQCVHRGGRRLRSFCVLAAPAVLRAPRRGSGPWALDLSARGVSPGPGPWALDWATVKHIWLWTGTVGPGFGVLRAPNRGSGPWALDLATAIHFWHIFWTLGRIHSKDSIVKVQ